jgi:hypothetical protein
MLLFVEPYKNVVLCYTMSWKSWYTSDGSYVAIILPSRTSLQSFPMNIGALPSVDEFGASLRLMIGSLNTLFRLAGYLAVNRVRMLFARRTRKTEQPLRGPAISTQSILIISDVSKLPPFAEIAWVHPDDAEIALAAKPADQSHISILMCTPRNGSVQLAVTFYASHIDKSLVARGLSRALSSAALKSRPETILEPYTERDIR